MRVTGSMISDQIIQNLNIDLARLQEVHLQTSTGLRINKPSDDPLGAQRVVNIKEALSGITQYQRNSDFVANWTSASESALAGVADAMKRANALAIRGGNDATLTVQDLNTMADEVNQILEYAVGAANTDLEGRRIFGGYQTQTDPFQATRVAGVITAVAYAGDSGVDQVEVDLGLTVNMNVAGDAAFMPAAGTDVFATLIALRDNLRSGNQAGITAGITQTDVSHDQLVHQVSLLGNKTNLLEMTGENLAAKKIGLTKLGSQLADTDMPEAVVRLQTAQNIYTAALESSARVLQQPGLMDFLK